MDDASRREPQAHESTFLGNEGVDRYSRARHELVWPKN